MRVREHPYRLLAVLTLVAGLEIGLGLLGSPSAPVWLSARMSAAHLPVQTRNTNSAITTSSHPPSVSLPNADGFNQIAIQNGELVLLGELASTVNQQTSTCVRAPVDPHALRVGPAAKGSCNNPASTGELVGTASNELSDSNNATLSLTVVDPATGSVSVGPTLFTFCNCSDTRPLTVTGDGWLWIYDVTVNGPELLQASATTGQIVDLMPMPSLYRPNMTAGNGGLWIGNSLEAGTCSGCQAPDALYFVTPGASAPTPVVHRTDLLTCWLVSDGNRLWVGMGSQHEGCAQQSIWKFVGTAMSTAFQAPDQNLGSLTVVGNEAEGLWTVRWERNHQQVVRIDPDTGATSIVTTLASIPNSASEENDLLPGQAVVDGRSLYVMEPGGYLGVETLLRLPLRSRGAQG